MNGPAPLAGHPDIQVQLAEARAAWQGGRSDEALRRWRIVGATEPGIPAPYLNIAGAAGPDAVGPWLEGAARTLTVDDPVSLRNLGVLAARRGEPRKAYPRLRRSVVLAPCQPASYGLLAKLPADVAAGHAPVRLSLQAALAGATEDARWVDLLSRLLHDRRDEEAAAWASGVPVATERRSAALLRLVVHSLVKADKHDGARPSLARLLDLEPRDAALRSQSAVVRRRDGDAAGAVREARRAVLLDPGSPEMQGALGKEVARTDQDTEAARLFRRILRVDPLRRREALENLSAALVKLDRTAEADRVLREALVRHPGSAGSYLNLSTLAMQSGDLARAARYGEITLAADPTRVSYWLNYGAHLRALGQYTAAVRACEHAQTLAEAQKDKDQGASARFNRGMTYVTMGELEVGFKLLEARWATPAFPSPKRSFRQAIWKGPQVHPQANLLCYMEQGMGDEVMLSWYLPLLRQDTKRLVVDCDERLVALFQRTYEGIEFVPRSVAGDPRTRDPDLQFKVPVLHTPQYYVPQVRFLARANWHWAAARGTRFPARLVLEPERLAKWDNWLEERFPGRPRLSLSWRSKIRNRMRNQQYLNTEELAEALPDGVVGINLQYSSTEDEVAELQEYCRPRGIDIVTPEGVDLTNDLEDIFALLQVSDAAVTPMISLAWMAGAVGCPGYIFRTSRERIIWQQFCLPFVTWAPSLRLFFRDPSETWDATTRELNSQLTAFLARGSGRERLTFG